jgi:hypothetical protein
MGRILLSATVWGLLGMVALPALLYFAVLGLSHAFDPRCATPAGDPGCAAGAFGIALASAIPAFALFFLFGVIAGRQRLRRRTARDFAAVLDDAGDGGPSVGQDRRRP